jgi:predicted RNase H-like HicB family nuclease
MAESAARTQFLPAVTHIRRVTGSTRVARSRINESVHSDAAVTVRPTAGGWKTVKTLFYWRAFEIEIETDENGWLVGKVAELPGCYTQARTEEELIERLREAVEVALIDSDNRLTKALFCPPRPK